MVGDTFSSLNSVNFGIPQGSILGPISVLIYVNQILDLDLAGSIIAFTDDLCLTYSALIRVDLASFFRYDLHMIRYWFADHILITSAPNPPDLDFIYHGPLCH